MANDKDVFKAPQGGDEMAAGTVPEFLPFTSPPSDDSGETGAEPRIGRDWLAEMKPVMEETAKETSTVSTEARTVTSAEANIEPPAQPTPSGNEAISDITAAEAGCSDAVPEPQAAIVTPSEVALTADEIIHDGEIDSAEADVLPKGSSLPKRILSYVFRPKRADKASVRPVSRRKKTGTALILFVVATAAIYLVFGDTGNVLSSKESKGGGVQQSHATVPVTPPVAPPVLSNMSTNISHSTVAPGAVPGVQSPGVAPLEPTQQSAPPSNSAAPAANLHVPAPTPAAAVVPRPPVAEAPAPVAKPQSQPHAAGRGEAPAKQVSHDSMSDEDFVREVAQLRKKKILAQYRSEIAKFEREAKTEKETSTPTATRALPPISDVVPPPIPMAKSKGPGGSERKLRKFEPMPSAESVPPVDAETTEDPLPQLLAVNALSRAAVVQIGGAIVNVHEGEMVGDYLVSKIGSASISLDKDRKHKVVYLSSKLAKKGDRDGSR